MNKLTPVYHHMIGACDTVKVGHQFITPYLVRRIEELSSELNEQQREFEKNNTKKRIVQGKGIEPTPSKLN